MDKAREEIMLNEIESSRTHLLFDSFPLPSFTSAFSSSTLLKDPAPATDGKKKLVPKNDNTKMSTLKESPAINEKDRDFLFGTSRADNEIINFAEEANWWDR
jgi:hypothetical protein